MADYGFNTNLGPQAQQATSLGDMINLAKGIQSYQQQQQLNPLQLRQEQAKTKLAEETLQPQIEEKQATAGSAKLKLNSEQTNALYGLAGGVLNDPRLNSKDPQDVMGALYEAKQRASTYGIPKEQVDGVFQPLFDAAQHRPQAVKQAINNIVQSRITPESQTTLQAGEIVEINNLKYRYNKATGQLVPLSVGAGNVGGGNPPKETTPKETKPSSSGVVKLDNFTSPGQFTEQEKSRYNIGQKEWEVAPQIAKEAANSSLATSQIRRYLSQAAGSKPEQIVRNAGQALFGNSELDKLLKNLAEQQVRQAQMMGIDTKYAQDISNTANGSANITAEALASILERADAQNIAAQKYVAGLKAMQDKHGKDKTYLNTDNYKAAFATNYDPVAFIIQSVNRSNRSQQEKDRIIKYYEEKLSDDEFEDLIKHKKALKALERGDF